MISWLPIEKRLQTFADSFPDRFPVRTSNYWNRYTALVDFLRTSIYPHINAGLACLSKSPGIYTDHGGDHFDEVVRYAGELIEPTFGKGDEGAIDPYDLYLLLAAIRLHDAGNIDGRENHEKRATSLLKEAGAAVCPDDDEASLIGQIAEAHGGITEGGGKDTIGRLSERSGMGIVKCNPQMVAALVRFADEICEHATRESPHHLKAGNLPAKDKLFHLYAQSVKQASLNKDQKSFEVRLVLDAARLSERFPTPLHTSAAPNEKYLLDDALDRIDKLNLERIYCNRFLPPLLRTERIFVKLEIVQIRPILGGHSIREKWLEEEFTIQERGYPYPDASWRTQLPGISGEAIASKLSKVPER